MRHYWLTSDTPDLPASAFRRALGKNHPATLEGGKGGSAPSAPDPWTTAAATTSTNENTAAYNKALNLNNYSNPFGSQQTTQTGTDPNTGAPIYGTTTTANSGLMNLYGQLIPAVNQSTGINSNALSGLQGIGSQYGGINNSLNTLGGSYSNLNGQLSNLGTTLNAGAAQNAQQKGADAAYQSSMGYLQPQFKQQQESTAAQLANQGLQAGSQAWNNAETNLAQNQSMQQQQALNNAQLTGSQIGTQNWQNQLAGLGAQAGLLGQEANNVSGLAGLYGQQSSNLGAQAGLYGQQVGIGQTPYSNLSTAMGWMPGYSGTGQSSAQPADIAGYLNNQYQSQLAGYNANTSSSNAMMGTLGSLGGAAMIAMGF